MVYNGKKGVELSLRKIIVIMIVVLVIILVTFNTIGISTLVKDENFVMNQKKYDLTCQTVGNYCDRVLKNCEKEAAECTSEEKNCWEKAKNVKECWPGFECNDDEKQMWLVFKETCLEDKSSSGSGSNDDVKYNGIIESGSLVEKIKETPKVQLSDFDNALFTIDLDMPFLSGSYGISEIKYAGSSWVVEGKHAKEFDKLFSGKSKIEGFEILKSILNDGKVSFNGKDYLLDNFGYILSNGYEYNYDFTVSPRILVINQENFNSLSIKEGVGEYILKNVEDISEFAQETAKQHVIVRDCKLSYGIENGEEVTRYYGLECLNIEVEKLKEELSKGGVSNVEYAYLYELNLGISNKEEFIYELIKIAEDLDVHPEYLLAVMNFETGGTYDSCELNKAGSGAIGLIQFTDIAIKDINQKYNTELTKQKLCIMSNVEQLKYVKYYFELQKGYHGPITNLEDAYMAVLWPAGIGEAPNYIIIAKNNPAYKYNKGLDLDGNGVTKVEATSKVKERYLEINPAFVS